MMERLMNIDRRVIFIFVFLGVAVPLLIDFHFPIKPTAIVRSVYDEVEKVAEKKGVMLMCFSYGASTESVAASDQSGGVGLRQDRYRSRSAVAP